MDSEAQIAREIAADESGYTEHSRAAFRAGWDKAMEYVVGKVVEHLDDDECRHFQDRQQGV